MTKPNRNIVQISVMIMPCNSYLESIYRIWYGKYIWFDWTRSLSHYLISKFEIKQFQKKKTYTLLKFQKKNQKNMYVVKRIAQNLIGSDNFDVYMHCFPIRFDWQNRTFCIETISIIYLSTFLHISFAV